MQEHSGFLVFMFMLMSSALLVKEKKTNKWVRSSYVYAAAAFTCAHGPVKTGITRTTN